MGTRVDSDVETLANLRVATAASLRCAVWIHPIELAAGASSLARENRGELSPRSIVHLFGETHARQALDVEVFDGNRAVRTDDVQRRLVVEVEPHAAHLVVLPAEERDGLAAPAGALLAACDALLSPVPTSEDKALLPTSVYAISKMDQELLCLAVGAAYGIDVVALRYFNAYGPRQALSNPYTGVAAIFSGRLLNGRAPLAFEDGQQLRDFIHVRDVARATVLALDSDDAVGQAINVGVGNPLTIVEVAELLGRELGVEIDPEVTGKFRAGDIRHCWADPTRAEKLLRFRSEIPLEDGVAELIEWVSTQNAADGVDQAYAELGTRGLTT